MQTKLMKIFAVAVLLIMAAQYPLFAQENFKFTPVIRNIGAEETDIKQANPKLFANLEVNKNYHARKYTLGPNDIINISVLGATELSQTAVRVQPDGKINLTYLPDLNVTGMTIEQLQQTIEKKYTEYLVDPRVSITLSQSRPFIIYISGGIYNPGAYELNTVTNSTPYYSKPEAFIERKTPLLSNIIVAAGGLSYDADIEHVKVINELDGTSFEVNLYNLISNADSSQDVYLMAGDKIFIPKLPTPMAISETKYRELAKSTFFQRQIPVRVIGYVNNPGLIKLESSDSGSLNSAIAAAGGYASGASYVPKRVFISRLDNNSKLITKAIDPRREDVAIMPNDVIYVPEKIRPQIGKGFDYMFRALAPFYTFSNIYDTWDSVNKR